jgi:DNA mismatch repair ATPase MutS
LLKAVFLIEVFTLFELIEQVESKRESLLILFSYIGAIDVFLSVASLRAGALSTCRPTILAAGKKFSAKNAVHPLLSNCATNDIDIYSRSALITGSNMSSKTTFLRTIITNSILAQTIYTCSADKFETPILKQFSSIRFDDSLLEGTSYYLEEVNTMASLMNEAASSDQNLFILDEVFKGTNTIERIASAKAILSYLNRNSNIVIVSTHDIELSKMLERNLICIILWKQ